MNFTTLTSTFPDLDFDGLPLSKIPRIRVIFSRKNFRGMQRDLDFILRKITIPHERSYLLNQLCTDSPTKKRIRKEHEKALDFLGLGNIYNYSNLREDKTENGIIYCRIIPVTYEELFHIAIIDAWGRTRKGEKHGLPHIEMDNILFSEELNYLIHINFICLNKPDIDGIDISSYDKKYLNNIATYFRNSNFEVWTDKIDEFNV